MTVAEEQQSKYDFRIRIQSEHHQVLSETVAKQSNVTLNSDGTSGVITDPKSGGSCSFKKVDNYYEFTVINPGNKTAGAIHQTLEDHYHQMVGSKVK